MNYKEMLKFLEVNKIKAIQFVIAFEVNAQLEENISDEEFEQICKKIYNICIDCIEEPDIWLLVDEELSKKRYKQN